MKKCEESLQEAHLFMNYETGEAEYYCAYCVGVGSCKVFEDEEA